MKNIICCILICCAVHGSSLAQCKPLDFATFKSFAIAADNAKAAMLVKAGYKKGPDTYDPDAGTGNNYTACWVNYKDGYNRFAQQITWYAKYKIISFNTLDKINYDQLKISIKKSAKYLGTEAEKTESYQDAKYIYTLQVVDFNEPAQKKHPSYVIAIAPLKL